MRFYSLLTLLLVAGSAEAAIAFDVGTPNVSTATATTCNFSHAAAASGVTLALVFVGLDADVTISNATYAGNAMSLIRTSGTASAAADEKMHLYAAYDPPDGTQTVDIDYGSDDHHFCLAMTFTGTLTTSSAIVQSTGYDNSGAVCATAPTTLVLGATTNWMITSSVWQGADEDPFTPTNCADRQDGDTGGGSATADDSFQQCDSTGSSGSVTHTITPTGGDECGSVSVEITDIAPPAVTPRRQPIFMAMPVLYAEVR